MDNLFDNHHNIEIRASKNIDAKANGNEMNVVIVFIKFNFAPTIFEPNNIEHTMHIAKILYRIVFLYIAHKFIFPLLVWHCERSHLSSTMTQRPQEITLAMNKVLFRNVTPCRRPDSTETRLFLSKNYLQPVSPTARTQLTSPQPTLTKTLNRNPHTIQTPRSINTCFTTCQQSHPYQI